MASCQAWLQIQFGGQLMVENCQKCGVHLSLNESTHRWLWQKALRLWWGLSWCLCQNRCHMWWQCAGDDQESKWASWLGFLGYLWRWMWSIGDFSWYQGEVDGSILSLVWEEFYCRHVLCWLKYRYAKCFCEVQISGHLGKLRKFEVVCLGFVGCLGLCHQ
jgi:hypothetical protein